MSTRIEGDRHKGRDMSTGDEEKSYERELFIKRRRVYLY